MITRAMLNSIKRRVKTCDDVDSGDLLRWINEELLPAAEYALDLRARVLGKIKEWRRDEHNKMAQSYAEDLENMLAAHEF